MNLQSALAICVATCLLAAPWNARAQSAPIPMQAPATAATAPPVPSARNQPLAWSSLDPTQQLVLTPVHEQWNQLSPQRQHRLARHARRWATLPPEQQRVIRKRLARWVQMTPEQRRRLHRNARAFHQMTPAERTRVRAAYQRFRALPPAERRALRERWRKMSPEQRRQWATESAAHTGAAHPAPQGSD